MNPSGIGVCSRGFSPGGETYCGLPGALSSDGVLCCCCPYGLTPEGGDCCCRGSVFSCLPGGVCCCRGSVFSCLPGGGCCGPTLPGTPSPVGGGEGKLPNKFPSFLT